MRYHNITKDDFLNGAGVRVVLWVSGCEHYCDGCQNQITWNPDCGLLFDEAAKAEIFAQLDESYIAGITFSGGDPLHSLNRDEILVILREVKEMYPHKNVWLYTGDSWEDIYSLPHMKYIDVLVDGQFEKDKKDNRLMWKGSSNQRVIDVQKTLQSEDMLVPVLWCGDYYDEELIIRENEQCEAGIDEVMTACMYAAC